MFLSKRVYSLVKNSNNLNNSSNNTIKLISINYYSTKKSKVQVSNNLKKLIKKPIVNKKVKDVSSIKSLLSKYTLENLDDVNDNPTYDEIDEDDDENEEFQFDSKLNFDITQDPLYRKDMEKQLKEEELEKQREIQRMKYNQEQEQQYQMYFKEEPKNETPQDKRAIDEEMRLEFWARQMALRDSLKNDGGRYLLDETAYLEPIKNYKMMGRKLMKRRQDEKEKEREEKRILKEKMNQQKIQQLGLTEEQASEIHKENYESKLKSKQALKDLLTDQEFEQYEKQLIDNEMDNEDGYEEGDEDDDDGMLMEKVDKDELYEEDNGLPNLSRLHPFTSVPAPIEIVQELLEIRKQDLIKKTEEASDEFERKRRIKRIEFMAKKKELQHKQMLERFKKLGIEDSLVKGDDDLPIEIDPKVFSRFQAGEITEEEMLEISKNQNKLERDEEDGDEEDGGEVDGEKRSRKDTDYLRHWKIGSIGIPPLLKKKIASTIKDYPTNQLRNDAAQLSDSLRERTRLGKSIGSTAIVPKPEDKPVIVYGKGQALAYISHRMPGVYACTHRVFSEIHTRIPNFSPASLLDYGSGPGTVLWSANTIWGESIKKIKAVEPSTHMTDIAKKLLEGNTNRVRWTPYLNTDSIKRGDGTIAEADQSELVTASYVLSELPSQEARHNLVKELWSHVKSSGMLVLIEPGTPVGFNIIKEVRQLILDIEPQVHSLHKSTKAQVVAPCPHSERCPMGSLSWCHFSQRVERPQFQKLAKGPASTMPYEDEKYSYIVLSKVISSSIPNQLEKQEAIYGAEELKATKPWSRLIEAPLKRGGHILLDVCSPSGTLNRVTIAKSHGKQIYREARKSFWSDAFILDQDTVHVSEGRFNVTAEEELEQQQALIKEQEQLEKSKQQKLKQASKSSIQILTELEEQASSSSSGGSVGKTKKEKKEKEKSKDWMKDLQGGDRKILEKLIKQGKFSEESTGLFGQDEHDPITAATAAPIPSSDYGTSEMALGFMEDVNDFDDEEEAKERKQKKTIYDLPESSKSRKGRKEKLLSDLNRLKKQEMSEEQRKQQELFEEEIRNQRKSFKENNPKNIEYYLKNFDELENKNPAEDLEQHFKEKLQHQREMTETFKNVKGLGLNSKTTREKLLEKKQQTEKFKKLNEKKKLNNNINNNNNNDDFNNVD